MTTLPPEIEGRLQEILCQVHVIKVQQLIRDLVTEQQAEIEQQNMTIYEVVSGFKGDHEVFCSTREKAIEWINTRPIEIFNYGTDPGFRPDKTFGQFGVSIGEVFLSDYQSVQEAIVAVRDVDSKRHEIFEIVEEEVLCLNQ